MTLTTGKRIITSTTDGGEEDGITELSNEQPQRRMLKDNEKSTMMDMVLCSRQCHPRAES